jgi:hypothetical protein
VESPPEDTRARIRGEVVRRLSRAGTKYAADWIRIHDLEHHRELDLADPFETEERWRDIPAMATPLQRASGSGDLTFPAE